MADAPPEPVSYSPPRFWWLIRGSLAAVVVAGVVVGFHVWLTRHVEASEAAMLASWRGDGLTHPDDFANNRTAPPNTPDNGAFLLNQAFGAIPAMNQEQSALYNANVDWFPIPDEYADTAASIERDAKPALDLVRQARDLPGDDWGIYAGNFNTFLPNLNPSRELANRLTFALSARHHDGDVAGAIEYALDTQRIARSMPRYGPTLVSSLVATGIHAMANDRLWKLTLHRPPGLSEEQERAAWREARPQAQAAIANLLDDAIVRELSAQGFAGERSMNALMPAVMSGPGGGAALGVVFGPADWNVVTEPFHRSSLMRTARQTDAAAQALRKADTIGEFQSDLDARGGLTVDPPGTVAGAAGDLLRQIMLPSLDRAIQSFFRVRTERHAAAIALAVKLYEADHDGQLPASLDALVPAYLPFVPGDPYAVDGLMRYRTDGPLPIVYSVGEDGEDDGGSVAVADGSLRQPPVRDHYTDKQDFVFPLRRSPVEGVDEYNYLLDGGKALLEQKELLEGELE